jgi:hypothetical protein
MGPSFTETYQHRAFRARTEGTHKVHSHHHPPPTLHLLTDHVQLQRRIMLVKVIRQNGKPISVHKRRNGVHEIPLRFVLLHAVLLRRGMRHAKALVNGGYDVQVWALVHVA